MDDLLYDASDVAMSFRVIKGSELRRRFVETSVGRYVAPLAID